MPYDEDGNKIRNPTEHQKRMYKKTKKKRKQDKANIGTGLADKAKTKILSRREQIEKALKDAGA